MYEHSLSSLATPNPPLPDSFPNVDLAGDNPLGQCQREQQNSFTVALELPSAPGPRVGAPGMPWMIQWLEIKGERCVRC